MFLEINRLSNKTLKEPFYWEGNYTRHGISRYQQSFGLLFFFTYFTLLQEQEEISNFILHLTKSITFTSISGCSTLQVCYYLGAGLWGRENESIRMQHQVCWISSCAAELLIDLPLGISASVSDSIWNYLWEGDGSRKLQRKWEWQHYCRKQTRQQYQRCISFIQTAINFSSSTSRGSFWWSTCCL